MPNAELIRLEALSDNYIWLLRNSASEALAVIDPGEAEAVIHLLDERGLTPTEIINTHHHGDHIGGNAELQERWDLPLTAPASEAHRIKGITQQVKHGDKITIADYEASVIATPGHTLGHVAFYVADCLEDGGGVAFVGDTLFSLGCGRVFEGSMEEMWHSLLALRALPDNTLVACGHEYSEQNARYVESLGWSNPDTDKRCKEIYALRAKGEPTLPISLGVEKRANPFMNCDNLALAEHLGCKADEPVSVFTKLRQGKDAF